MAWRGAVGSGVSRCGSCGRGWRGLIRCGEHWSATARQFRPDLARLALVGYGQAVLVCYGMERPGEFWCDQARFGLAVMVRQRAAWRVEVRPGASR